MVELKQGDCIELMKDIPDSSADMILCDLPYGTTACKWDNVIPFEPLWEQYKRVVRENGAIVLFGIEPLKGSLYRACVRCNNKGNIEFTDADEEYYVGNELVANKLICKEQIPKEIKYKKYDGGIEYNFFVVAENEDKACAKAENMIIEYKKIKP